MPLNGSRYGMQKILSFGVEFEFYVNENILEMSQGELDAVFPIGARGVLPREWYSTAAYYILGILNNLNLRHPAVVAGNYQTQSVPNSEDELEYRVWVIKTDPTLQPEHGNSRPWLGLEIASPILDNRNNGQSCREVKRIGEALVNSQYVRFNQMCGFHVHVGNWGHGIPLEVCQRLFSLLFMYGERLLDVLFRSDRQNNPNCESIGENIALIRFPSWRYRISGTAPERYVAACFPHRAREVPPETRRILWRIWAAGNLNEFSDMTSIGFKLAINFIGLKSHDPPTAEEKPTVEFRKAEGDLSQEGNLDFLLYWPQVCLGLLAFGYQDRRREFARVMRAARHAFDAPVSEAEKLEQFLNSMQFDPTVVRMLRERAASLSQHPRPTAPGAVFGEQTLNLAPLAPAYGSTSYTS